MESLVNSELKIVGLKYLHLGAASDAENTKVKIIALLRIFIV